MKIALFLARNLAEHNADSLIIHEPLKYLMNYKDLDIYLIAPNNIPEDLKTGLTYIRYRMSNRPILRSLSAFSAILKLLREDYDLYHVVGPKAAFILFIALKLKRQRSPILYSGFEIIRAIDMKATITGKRIFKNRILRCFLDFRRSIALKNSDGLIVRAEGYKNYILENGLYKNKIFVIPYAIDTEFFGKKYEKDTHLSKKLGLTSESVIMYTGEISPIHGVLDLVKALEILNSKVKNIVLVIVGDGSFYRMVKDYVLKRQLRNVIFTGRVSHDEIPMYHSIADVLVIPHLRRIDSELLYPSKLLECLASGKPIVASNLKAIANVVGDNAILVAPEDPQALADAILALLNDKELSRKKGENGKKIIYNYSWEETAQKTYGAYKDLIFSTNS